jgi:hypothetical protein
MTSLLALLFTACTMTRPTHDQALERVRAITAQTQVADLEAAWGHPTADIGSGIHIFVYPLADEGELRVGSADGKTVMYVMLDDRKVYGN